MLPEVLYHGTKMSAVLNPNGFSNKVINENFMNNIRSNDRDFGTGFYTTVDFRQAANWAKKALVSAENSGFETYPEQELPVVLKIHCQLPSEFDAIEVYDFRGESDKWSDFILLHRYKSSLNNCACINIFGHEHPQIVCGPMADNDTGSVIALFKDQKREILNESDRMWFREEITKSEDGRRRVGLDLGDQLAWFGETLNSFLTLDGYYKLNMDSFLGDEVTGKNYWGEWDYYGN